MATSSATISKQLKKRRIILPPASMGQAPGVIIFREAPRPSADRPGTGRQVTQGRRRDPKTHDDAATRQAHRRSQIGRSGRCRSRGRVKDLGADDDGCPTAAIPAAGFPRRAAPCGARLRGSRRCDHTLNA
ncbi:hypothetical protein CV_0923 [Chromobacterium violaceum ATCC 12472]|uniref:Uncharacterized protein n=1 Tax=Chromobacterium violaceum (strain ATCC 12472 / DSM 30191 / JCM 1249 / CCUG 213 / NBRC 12614 / NCIMB 9131 / NCTC 9757 / MK) TaxID=243365 RepID=Q7NZJ9_CHRVO|nr:hypothetical protein CV_0923 [Chromobacterium violaceum ATCC 12472]